MIFLYHSLYNGDTDVKISLYYYIIIPAMKEDNGENTENTIKTGKIQRTRKNKEVCNE